MFQLAVKTFTAPQTHFVRLLMAPIGKQVDAADMTTSTTVMDLSGDVSGAVFYDYSTEEVTVNRLLTRHS